MNQVKVSQRRHISKTISYRIISTLVGFLIMWWVTGKIEIGAAFGVIELLYKPIQYYIHERIWYRYIKYGLIKVESEKEKDETQKVLEEMVAELKKPEEEQKIKRLTYTKKSDN